MESAEQLKTAIRSLRTNQNAWGIVLTWLVYRKNVAIKQLSEIDNEITLRRLQGQVQTLESIIEQLER